MQVMSTTSKLVIDIETIGEDFEALDKDTQANLTRWIKRDSESDEEYKIALEDLKNGLGFSPLTGEIVAIGLLDYHKNEGAVYYQAPGQKNEEVKWQNLEVQLSFSTSKKALVLSHLTMAAKISLCMLIM